MCWIIPVYEEVLDEHFFNVNDFFFLIFFKTLFRLVGVI